MVAFALKSSPSFNKHQDKKVMKEKKHQSLSEGDNQISNQED
jgi:hypothetical protein